MLNYYYDPILGLQCTNLSEVVSLDLSSIPELPTDLVLKMFMEQGVQFLENIEAVYHIVNLEQITDYQI